MARRFLLFASMVVIGACSSPPSIPTAERVDLNRFMGDWYVIANIPTFLEKGAHNAVESYRLKSDGTVATTFTFRAGGFEGPQKAYRSTAFIIETGSNALWGMQFVWPFTADYRIVYVNEEYSRTIIGRNKRDYVWIMARSPHISEGEYERLLQIVQSVGYDVSEVQKVPQRWGTP